MKKLFLISLFLGFTTLVFAQHFINDAAYRKQVHEDFLMRKTMAQGRGEALFGIFLQKLTTEETEALEFLYAYMPLSDLADYDGDFFLQQVRTALLARDNFAWCKTIPEEIFRHFVLVYRVNNENLDSAKMVFYDELKDRISGMDMYEAALEVNHWCHEKVAYRPSDIRTSSPLATVQTALGRCGEESTFTVTALRAVGIPARQCYTPRWAHTDDNHAWVEVWVDGRWYFLGACEPDPELNMGWFAIPSTRTMMVHSNAFGKYNGKEEITHQSPLFSRINMLPNYADTKKITITVLDGDGKPVENATVKFKLYNYAEYYTIAEQKTDRNGHAQITTGLGDLLIWATDGTRFGYKKMDMRQQTTLDVVMDKLPGREYVEELTIVPPVGKQEVVTPCEHKAAKNQQRLHYEDSVRTAYMATFKTEKDAASLSCKNLTEEQVGIFLKKAEGNYAEVEMFIRRNGDVAGIPLAEFMQSWSDKDFRDMQADIMQDHLTRYDKSKPYSYEAYLQGIVSPRVSNEGIRPWRGFLGEKLRKELKGTISVRSLVAWVQRNITLDEGGNYYNCPITPQGVYELRLADSHSRDIFLIAACRALDIPAYMDEATGNIFIYENGTFRLTNLDASQQGKTEDFATLTIDYQNDSDLKPGYYTYYTIERFENGDYISLDFENDPRASEFPFSTRLQPGHYLLSTGNRYSDGTTLSRLEFFEVKAGEHLHKDLVIRDLTPRAQDYGTLAQKEISIVGKDAKNADYTNSWKVEGESKLLVCFIDPTREPTKHLLKEIAAKKSDFEALAENLTVVFIGATAASDFNFAAWNLPSNAIFADFSPETKERWLKTVPSDLLKTFRDNYPLVVLADEKGEIRFFSEGYRIGTGDLILKMLK